MLLALSILMLLPFTASSEISKPQVGWYCIRNLATGKYLNVYGNSAKSNVNITLWQKDGTTGQEFYVSYPGTVKSNGTTNANSYAVSLKTRCGWSNGTVVNGDATTTVGNGTNVITWTYTNHVTQLWYLDALSGDTYRST